MRNRSIKSTFLLMLFTLTVMLPQQQAHAGFKKFLKNLAVGTAVGAATYYAMDYDASNWDDDYWDDGGWDDDRWDDDRWDDGRRGRRFGPRRATARCKTVLVKRRRYSGRRVVRRFFAVRSAPHFRRAARKACRAAVRKCRRAQRRRGGMCRVRGVRRI